MSDVSDALETAVLAALAEAVGDNDDDPVTAAEFSRVMWPSTVGAGTAERTGATQQAIRVLNTLVNAELVEETAGSGGAAPRYAVA